MEQNAIVELHERVVNLDRQNQSLLRDLSEMTVDRDRYLAWWSTETGTTASLRAELEAAKAVLATHDEPEAPDGPS